MVLERSASSISTELFVPARPWGLELNNVINSVIRLVLPFHLSSTCCQRASESPCRKCVIRVDDFENQVALSAMHNLSQMSNKPSSRRTTGTSNWATSGCFSICFCPWSQFPQEQNPPTGLGQMIRAILWSSRI